MLFVSEYCAYINALLLRIQINRRRSLRKNIQLILSGFVFELADSAKNVSRFTISKWGLNGICIAADINTMNIAPENYILLSIRENNLAAYDPGNYHLLKLWLALLGIAFVCGVFTRLFLGFIDKDEC